MPLVPPNPIITASPEEQIGLIHGQAPDSINEWYVYLALEKLKLDFTYQYPLGTPGTRGSQFIDFVVWSGGGGIPVEIQGTYWHNTRNDPERAIKLVNEERRFHHPVVELAEDETNTREKALEAVRKKVR